MAQNFLQLNKNKLPVVLFDPRFHYLDHQQLRSTFHLPSALCKGLGVIFDSAFKFDKLVKAVEESSFLSFGPLPKLNLSSCSLT